MSSSVKFSADTGPFIEPVQRATSEIKAMQRELNGAKKAAADAFREARLEAKAAGASTEELRKLDQQYARDLVAIGQTQKQINSQFVAGSKEVVTQEEAKARAISLVTDKLKAQREELNRQPLGGGGDHYTPSRQQQASAILRGAGGTVSIRAAESFASTLPGFSTLSGALFPIAGAAALTTELVKGAEALYRLRQEGVNAGKALHDAFQDAADTTRQHGVELDLTNDRLDRQIAKLEHKPSNGLKTALDEDRKAAYELTAELARSGRAVDTLLKEHGVSSLKSLGSSLLGYNVADTTDQEKLIRQTHENLTRVSRAGNDALDNATPQNAEAVRQQNRITLQASLTAEINKTNDALQKVYANQREGKGVDFSPQTSVLEGQLDELKGQRRNLGSGFEATDKDRQKQGLEEAKEAATAAKAAAREVAEAQRKAAEEQRKQWDDDYAEFQQTGTRTVSQEIEFWLSRLNAVTVGSENYLRADKQVSELIRKANQEREKSLEQGIKLREQFGLDSIKGVSAIVVPGAEKNAKGISEQQKSLQELTQAQDAAKFAIAQANIQSDLQAGRISKADAAVQLQTLHTIEYEAALKRLRDQLAAVQDPGAAGDAQRNGIQRQIAELDARNGVQAIQDGAAVAGETWRGALKKANALFVQDSQDSAKQVTEIYGALLSGINGDLSKAFSEIGERGHRHIGRELGNAVGGTLRGVGGQVANIGLQRAESGLLSSLGIGGKADGSRGNPLNVFVTNSIDGKDPGVAGATSAVRSLASGSDIGGSVRGFAQSALSFLPGGSFLSGIFGGARAMGGDVQAGRTFLVGENGPELFSPGSTGYITPNNRLSMGGTGDMHFNVDARGATDPAAVKAMVQQGIMQAAPHIIAASGKQQKDDRLRMPRSSS